MCWWPATLPKLALCEGAKPKHDGDPLQGVTHEGRRARQDELANDSPAAFPPRLLGSRAVVDGILFRMESKQQRERAYHNQAFAEGTREAVGTYYTFIDNSTRWFEQILAANCRNRSVLEYGCGPGREAFKLDAQGAKVTGIDISDVAIAQGTQRARLEERDICFRVMDAERLDFPDDSFDLICGVAILHHLDLRRAFSELARTIKPHGLAVFLEPLGHNPLVNLYRRATPHLRTIDEHPLLIEDFQTARLFFERVDLTFFNLQTLLVLPFRQLPGSKRAFRFLDSADRALFRFLPFTTRYAWQVVMSLSSPRKDGQAGSPNNPA